MSQEVTIPESITSNSGWTGVIGDINADNSSASLNVERHNGDTNYLQYSIALPDENIRIFQGKGHIEFDFADPTISGTFTSVLIRAVVKLDESVTGLLNRNPNLDPRQSILAGFSASLSGNGVPIKSIAQVGSEPPDNADKYTNQHQLRAGYGFFKSYGTIYFLVGPNSGVSLTTAVVNDLRLKISIYVGLHVGAGDAILRVTAADATFIDDGLTNSFSPTANFGLSFRVAGDGATNNIAFDL